MVLVIILCNYGENLQWGYSVAQETVRDELMATVEDDDIEVEWEEYSEGEDDDDGCGDVEDDDDVSFMSY